MMKAMRWELSKWILKCLTKYHKRLVNKIETYREGANYLKIWLKDRNQQIMVDGYFIGLKNSRQRCFPRAITLDSLFDIQVEST